MSRLTELEEQTAIGMLARLRAQQVEMKTTPQLTSAKSGVQTYQVPEYDLWDEFEFVHRLVGGGQTVTQTRAARLPGTGAQQNAKSLLIDTEYIPKYQDSPVAYPYLLLSIDDAEWEPFYSPSLGLCFRSKGGNSGRSIFSVRYLRKSIDFSKKKLKYKYSTMAFYSAPGNDEVTLRVRFRLRSTDRGDTTVRVELYD